MLSRPGNIRTPLSFADQLYVLREHISWVRRRLTTGPGTREVITRLDPS